MRFAPLSRLTTRPSTAILRFHPSSSPTPCPPYTTSSIDPPIGAEAIAFLKVYGVVPAAMAFMVGYSYAANHLNKRALFYVTILPFFAFYGAWRASFPS